MKNLFAAVVLAIIVFFLSSCGEAEILNVSSEPAEVSAKTEDVNSDKQLSLPICEVTISADEMIVSEDDLYLVTLPRPTKFYRVIEGQLAKMTIEDFGCEFIFERNRESQQKLLEGFELKRVCFENEVKIEGEVEVFTEYNRDRLLIKHDDGYIICVGDKHDYMKKPDMVDSVFISTSGVYYSKQRGDTTEIGSIQNVGDNYELIKTMELKTKDGYLFTVYDEFHADKQGKIWKYGVGGVFESDYKKHCDVIKGYLNAEGIAQEDVEVKLFLEEKNLSFVFDGTEIVPKELYFNGKLICQPSKLDLEGECDEHIAITYTGDKMMIYIYNIRDMIFSDNRTWLCFGDKTVELKKGVIGRLGNLKDLELNKDGKFQYRRMADGGTIDYLFHKSDRFSEFETFEEFLEYFEWLWGDEMPDVDAPHYEYGEIVIEDGEAVFKPTHTRSIRELFEEKDRETN